MGLGDAEYIVDYFLNASPQHLETMGVDPQKLPEKKTWVERITAEYYKQYHQKGYYYIMWEADGTVVGHSNINGIDYGESAVMHLHLWQSTIRKKGMGQQLLLQTLLWYFEKFDLQYLICEPNAYNMAPNKTLPKVGFELVRTYDTTPGFINVHQTVSRYVLYREKFEGMKRDAYW